MESSPKRSRTAVDVVLVGCGCPGRGMGWYHLRQLMSMSVNVKAVVEPFYMGEGHEAVGADRFRSFKALLEGKGIEFHKGVRELREFQVKTLCVICGRASENPMLFQECVEKKACAIYLEKPGASTVAELEVMKELAVKANVAVYMGYNKNVTRYVTSALEFEAQSVGAEVTFIHHNAFKREELEECFARNREGMLKNMLVHELALLVTYFEVTCENVMSLKAIREECEVLTLGAFTDFVRLAFTLTTRQGKRLTLKADRCGGSQAMALVHVGGEERFRTVTPDEELFKRMEEQRAAEPDVMPYFFLQSDDYLCLKQRVLKSLTTGEPARNVASIDIGIETLKLAEMLQQQLGEALV